MRRPSLLAAAVAVALLVAGCGSVSSSAPAATEPAPSSTAVATTSAVSSTATSTSTSTSTTLAATTTTEPLPVPQPPPDPRADEPRIEIGGIAIPSLGIVKPLLEGVSLTTLDEGPGHWPGTAMPGRIGNVVVAGHRTSYDRPFRYIDRLKPGDEVIFATLDGEFTYLVVSTEIVTPDQIRIIDQTRAYTATLFACHPVGSVRERIVVHLELAR